MKRIEGPFTNKFGQTFNPGDKAIAVTVCTGRTTVARVEYVGYVERLDYYRKSSEPLKYAQIRRPSKRLEWFDKTTGEKCKWSRDANVGARYGDYSIITTLQYNNLIADSSSVDALIKVL